MIKRYLPTLIFILLSLNVLAEETFVYFGTYTRGSSEGIYLSKLNTDTGELSQPVLTAKLDNPSFIAIHPNNRYLFTVSEETGDKAIVSSYTIEEDGSLSKMSHRPTKGNHPCHLTVDKYGKTLIAVNYSGGNVASYPLSTTGEIGEGEYIKHSGSSINKNRQKSPHPHSVNINPSNKRAFVADLGTDKIHIYKLSKPGKLVRNSPSSFRVPAGGGPRHLSFHPNGKFAFANLELTREAISMSYDANKGRLSLINKQSTLPDGAEASGSTAECLVHPTGKWLYISNRGHNSIAVFSIDQSSGKLTRIQVEPTKGKTPRGFGIDPSGKFLIAGHQNSDNIAVFQIDQSTGQLTMTDNSIKVNSAVNVRFMKPKPGISTTIKLKPFIRR